MAKEKNLTAVTSVAAADFARVITSAGASVKATFANVAKYIIETYNGSTVAGSAQSVKSALDSLNSKTTVRNVSYNFGGKSWIFYKVDRIVVVFAPSDITSASAGTNDITTSLPAEYRPPTQTYIKSQNSNDGMFLSVSASGLVRLYVPTDITSAHNCGIVGCYITMS